MPLVQGLPTWKNINSVNSTSSSGQTDNMTGHSYDGDGLYPGVHFDLTNEEAQAASNLGTGLLYSGHYRYVKVDSGATAANVTTGTVGYIRSGSTVKTVVVLTQGSGQTVGTYQVAATLGSGGGSGAVIQIVVTSATAITATVLNGGFGYVSPPTFTLATGGTVGTVIAQLGISMNVVTSADIAIGTASLLNAGIGPVHPVVFLNAITPGNYGFVQELGAATVIAGATFSQAQGYNAVPVNGSTANGTMTTAVNTYSLFTIGTVIDPLVAPLAGTPFKILLTDAVVQD